MKILILYGTKTGATQHCAEKIGGAIAAPDAVDLLDIAREHRLDLSPYDRVVIGTPIYMGRIHNKIKRFLERNATVLMTKQLHFFICGLARGEAGVALFQKQISTALFDHARQVRQLGNEIHLERMNFLYRFVMKKIVEEEKPATGLDEAGIVAFARNVTR